MLPRVRLSERLGAGAGDYAEVAWLYLFAPYRFGAIRLTPVAHHGPLILGFFQKKTKRKLIRYLLNETPL